MSSQPPGTFLPNTKVTVGSHKVYIEKYLSEGGFAHVYVVRVPRDNGKHEIAVLKRVAVPDKEHLANMRTEVETMKKLKGHSKIVTYYDSHASQLKGGGYEVFLLMEFCSGGGLIDFMNTRLQYRLTEPEILKIFGDVAEGVACMHYLKPPLLHRDLKVENVLISKAPAGGTPTYKLCDFGSTAPPRPAAKTADEGRLIEEDVQKHTTMQYRSPEMIDVWRKQPIDEKADIWALGVLLYKLCYYTTPFEDVGQMAILNASFKYPSLPKFSDRLKKLIGGMLKEDPRNRPNIYQVIKETCSMRGVPVPIKDIYANRTHSEARRNESMPSREPISSPPIGLQKVTPQVQVQSIPDIAPMRRGRPTTAPSPASNTPKAAASPARGDPFAALDSKNYDVRVGAVDELSTRFPSLDEFSIALDGGKFAFPSSQSTQVKAEPGKVDLHERVTMALADDAFSSVQAANGGSKAQPFQKAPAAQSPSLRPTTSTAVPGMGNVPAPTQSTALRSGVPYKSTAVGSSPPLAAMKPMDIDKRPIWRVSDHIRSASQPRVVETPSSATKSDQSSMPPPKRPELLDVHRSKSQTSTLQAAPASTSSRPSLEGGRPSFAGNDGLDVARTQSLSSRSRPASMYVSSDMDYLRDQEHTRSRPSLEMRRSSRQTSHSRQASQTRNTPPDESAITDDMDYLRNSEESGAKTGHHKQRASINAIGKSIGGRFSGAFKRFESQHSGDNRKGSRTPEPRAAKEEPQLLLSPIAGSEATKSRHSDTDEETEDIPIEVKRELERQHAAQEERRVAEAAAEYRARVAAQGTGSMAPPSRASTIQKRVQSLLDEGRQSPVPRKTAEGYGRYTDAPSTDAPDSRSPSRPMMSIQSSGNQPPIISPKPIMASNNPYPKTRQQQYPSPVPSPAFKPQPASPRSPAFQPPPSSTSAPPEPAPLQRVVARPSAPPKPKAFRTGGPVQRHPAQQETDDVPPPIQPPRPTGGLAALLAKDLEGVPDYPPPLSSGAGDGNTVRLTKTTSVPMSQPQDASLPIGDDLESFSKRYPTLSGIEMVETEIEGGRSREV
jgi:AP2-associated kinase